MAYYATYSYRGTTVKIHAADCPQARETPNVRAAWELRGYSLAEAMRDADESENLSSRGWSIRVCKCARDVARGDSVR
jgi:hypothetical protein